MLYNENNINVYKIASKGNGLKPVLESVMFTKDKTVATDSYRLIEMSVPKNAKASEFPKAMQGCKPFLVRARGIKDIKLLKNSTMPVVAIKHLDNTRAEFMTSVGDTITSHNLPRVHDAFPDYEKIFPTEKPLAEVELNGELLAELLEVMSKLNVAQRVKIKIYGTGKPVVLEAGNDNQKGRGMIMCMQ